MGPGYYVIAILGCADGSAACTPLATLAPRYSSEAACMAAAPDALMANSDLDSPNLIAQCRSANSSEAASTQRQEQPPRHVRRG